MTNIEMTSSFATAILMLLAFLNAYIIIMKREEGERAAFSKAISFSASAVVYFAVLEVMIGFGSSGFYVPLFYIIILIIAGCGINLIVYPLYLQYGNLELPFIRKCSNEKKVKIYGFLIKLNFVLMLLFMTLNIAYNQSNPHNKNIPIGSLGLWTCFFIEYLILSKMPRKKNVQPQKKMNMKQETVSILVTILILLIAAIIFLIIINRIRE